MNPDRARPPSPSASRSSADSEPPPRLLLVLAEPALARASAQALEAVASIDLVHALDDRTAERIDSGEFDLAVCEPASAVGPPAALLGRLPLVVLGHSPAEAGAYPDVAYVHPPVRGASLRAAVRRLLADRAPMAPWRAEFLALRLPPDTSGLLQRFAPTRVPVLLVGEPGSGRAVVAHFLHASRPGLEKAFVRNHPATSEADTSEHLLERAAGGSLYLENLHALPGRMQHRLADLLEAEAAGAAGSVRLLFADTAHSSEEVIEALEPRLGYRLLATAACLPPLATQPDRATSVARSYLRLVCGRYGLGPAEFSELALEAIASYHWPGNVEELRSAVTRAAFRVQGRHIEPADLGIGGQVRSTRPISHEVAATPQPPVSELEPPASEHGRDFAQIGYELAHEIKNPLVSIKTFTQLLAERFDDHEFRDQYYQLVLADVDRIDSILSEIIDYAQIPQHGAGPTDLNKVTRSVVNEFRFHARQQGVQIGLRLTRTAVSVAVDQVVARYVLSNVIRDGLAALGDSGRIEIHTTAAKQEGQLSVRYNLPRGEGRPESEQASSASPRRMLGLPLTLAAKALEVHLGSLEVNDTAEGQVTVSCRFPTGAE